MRSSLPLTDLGRRKQVTFVYPSPTKAPAEAEACRLGADADADAVLRSGVLGAYLLAGLIANTHSLKIGTKRSQSVVVRATLC